MRLGHARAFERPRGLLPPACETSIERARRGMRPEAGARDDNTVRGRALHHLHKYCIERNRGPYDMAWRHDGRLAVLLPACRRALLRVVCEVGAMWGHRAR
eukprot:5337204-Prymnesium_polylepis.1